MSDSLQPHGLQLARLPCPSPFPGVCSNSSPLSRWGHLIISFPVVPFSSSCPPLVPASGSQYISLFYLKAVWASSTCKFQIYDTSQNKNWSHDKNTLEGLMSSPNNSFLLSSYNKDVLPHHNNSFAMHSYDSQVDISSKLLAWIDFQIFTHVIRFAWMEFPSDLSTLIWQNHSHSSRYVLK